MNGLAFRARVSPIRNPGVHLMISLRTFFGAALTLLFWSECVQASVRPISDAERAAVEIAARYLADGPEAVASSLSETSSLRRIDSKDRSREIETRLGPPAHAEWKLATVVEALKDKTVVFSVSYPSGIDDTIFLDMVREGNGYRVHDIRNLAMPSSRGHYYPPLPVSTETKPEVAEGSLLPFGAIGAAFVALCGVFAAGIHRRTAMVLLGIAFLAGVTVTLLDVMGSRGGTEKKEPASAESKVVSQAALHPLRTALAAGGGDVEGLRGRIPRRGLAADAARLWLAQWDFQQGRLSDVESTLASLPAPSPYPLAHILRARLALAKNDLTSAILAYQHAINLGPGRDVLWFESSSALFAAGFKDQAQATLERVAKIGSRDADLYYMQAMLTADEDELEELLQRAWTLQPAERQHLLAAGVLWSTVRKRGPMLVDLSDPREAMFASPSLSKRAIAIPSATMPAVSGEFLQLESKGARLYVPGGAELAPIGTPTVDAGTWSRTEDESSFRSASSLIELSPSPATYMQPALRQRITASASALARRNRWAELVRLTEGVTPKSEFVPPSVFFLRASALHQLGRTEDAKRLLIDLAASPVLDRKRDARALLQLGNMLASYDMFKVASKMFERAIAVAPGEYADIRLAQVAMDERLATEYTTHRSTHFEIHYPPDLGPASAVSIAEVLEGELKRLQRWVPVREFKPVVVNIVWWREFKSTYTHSDNILGFYNGKITLPLAGIYEPDPMIVALITHELCHAMIAQATSDQAPRWFQEGLAQRVEMVPYSANAFNMYEDEKLLAVSVLDPVLDTSPDADMVGAAYIVSSTFMRFLEQRVGEAGIRNVISRFAAGDSTEDAIASVAGLSLADLDVEFRRWGTSEKRVFANDIAVRYDRPANASDKTEPRKRGQMDGGTLYPLKVKRP